MKHVSQNMPPLVKDIPIVAYDEVAICNAIDINIHLPKLTSLESDVGITQ